MTLGKNAYVRGGGKLTAAAAGILKDKHLLNTGLWQELTRLTNSQVPIVLAICHLIGCPAPEPPFSPSESQGKAELTCHYRCWKMPDTPLPSFPGSRHGQGLGQLAVPGQEVEPLTRDTEKQYRRQCSQNTAVAAASTCRWQSPGPG